jgi:hypothetical protein
VENKVGEEAGPSIVLRSGPFASLFYPNWSPFLTFFIAFLSNAKYNARRLQLYQAGIPLVLDNNTTENILKTKDL